MSETRDERQTGIEKRDGERFASVEADPRAPGSRTLQAGSEFLKALVSDLAAVASRLRLLPAEHRRTRPPQASALTRVSQRLTSGRICWRLSVVLLAFGTICAGALSAVTLWVLFGFPPEPRKSDGDTLASQFEARKGNSLAGVGPLNVTGASRQDFGREPEAQGRPVAEAMIPSIASSGASPPAQSDDSGAADDDRSFGRSGSSSAPTAEPKTQTGAEQPQVPNIGFPRGVLARTEPRDRRPAARQQEISGTLTDLRPRMQCNVDLCADTYASFHAADCTYQPHGGGPRRICELSTRPADARPQTSRAATDPRSEAQDTRIAERAAEVPKAATPARAGAQCNVDLCADTYASFHAADCTYQPHGGGPRRICER